MTDGEQPEGGAVDARSRSATTAIGFPARSRRRRRSRPSRRNRSPSSAGPASACRSLAGSCSRTAARSSWSAAAAADDLPDSASGRAAPNGDGAGSDILQLLESQDAFVLVGPADAARDTMMMAELRAATRALLVEDDPNIVDLIRSNLAVRGFDTVVSTDGSGALQLLETEEPDIVLLDLMLPGADGFELCRQIRERSSVAVIVVSARGGQCDKVTALNMGADDYMTKPFSVEELLARITATLRRTRAGRAPQPTSRRRSPSATSSSTSVRSRSRSAGRPRAPDADRVRAAARAGHQSRQAAQPRPSAAARLGTRHIRPKPSTSGSTSGGCGPSSRTTRRSR